MPAAVIARRDDMGDAAGPLPCSTAVDAPLIAFPSPAAGRLTGPFRAAQALAPVALPPRARPGWRRTIGAAPMTDAKHPEGEPWQWSEPKWRRIVGRARVGRSLAPASWPGGARCAVAISFDAD